MIKVVINKDIKTLGKVDYVFNNYQSFLEMAPKLQKGIMGSYTIIVHLKELAEVENLLLVKDTYDRFQLYMALDQVLYNFIATRHKEVRNSKVSTNWEVFMEKVTYYELAFEHGTMLPFYESIGHSTEEFEYHLQQLKQIFGDHTVTKDYLDKHYNMIYITYPREVLYSYLRRDRWANSKLNKCLKDFEMEHIFYSIRKNLKSLKEQMEKYYETGKAPNGFIKTISYENVLALYAIFFNNHNIKNCYILFSCFEKGETVDDLLYQ